MNKELECRIWAEIERLGSAKLHLYNYVKEVVLTLDGYVDGAHIELTCDTVEQFLKSDKDILLISMPPRHMKSTIVSHCLPAWYVSNSPQKEVIMAAYNLRLARKQTRSCRMKFDHPTHKRIFPRQAFAVDAADEIRLDKKVTADSNIMAVGADGGIAGFGADLVIIDDIVKGTKEASSPVIQDNLRSWYEEEVLTRLTPKGKVIIVGTRWHHSDLQAHVIATTDPEAVMVLNLPAIDDGGNALWPERYPIGALERIKSKMRVSSWESLYQGRPSPKEGNMFKRSHFKIVDAPFPPAARRVRFWDFAATLDGDFTAGVLLAMHEGRYCVEDVRHIQGTPATVQQLVMDVANIDGKWVKIRMEQEPGSAGVNVVDMYARKLVVGYDIKGIRSTGSKQIRAGLFAAAVENGNVDVVRARWNMAFLDEFAEFPLSKHDDQVDATVGAFTELTGDVSSTNVWFM